LHLFIKTVIKLRDVTVHQLLVDFEKACDSPRREVMYSVLIGFGIPINLVRLITM